MIGRAIALSGVLDLSTRPGMYQNTSEFPDLVEEGLFRRWLNKWAARRASQLEAAEIAPLATPWQPELAPAHIRQLASRRRRPSATRDDNHVRFDIAA
jgi:hypothetical protein